MSGKDLALHSNAEPKPAPAPPPVPERKRGTRGRYH
jgi:hypothetical protein